MAVSGKIMKKEERTGVIYMITNSINIKPYVGQTTDLNRRMRTHKRAKNKNSALHNAIRKYGWNCFNVIILHENVPLDDLDWLEKQSIWIWNCMVPNGYNLQAGGGSGLPSEETKEKIRKTALSQNRSGSRNPMYGRKHSEESKRKTRQSLKEWYKSKKTEDFKHSRVDVRNKTAEIIDLYQKGMSAVQLGKKYKCSDTLIKKILKENNINLRIIIRNDIRNCSDQIGQKYESGWTLRKLAKQYNCSHTLIKKILLEQGIHLRRVGKQRK